MSTVESHFIVPFGDARSLTAALAGAFADGVDLGPRGAQIRAVGESLGTMIEALRLELTGLGGQLETDGMLLDLDQLTHMAKAAQTYELDEAG